MAGVTNLTIEKGADFEITVTLNDASGAPIDLTEYIPTGKMRDSYYNNQNVFSIDCSNVEPPTAGNIKLSLPYTATSMIPLGRYFYDVIITDATNNIVKRVLEGIVIVTPTAAIFEGATGSLPAYPGSYDGLNWNIGATSFLRLH